jgi:hypothetical protein
MKIIRGILAIVLTVCFAVNLIQCAGTKTTASNIPGWINEGNGFYSGDKGTAFYGVGHRSLSEISQGVYGKIAIMQTRPEDIIQASDTQARAALARVFKTEIANLVKVYQREVTKEVGARAGISTKQFAKEVKTCFTQMDLSGVNIIDHFYYPYGYTQYSLAVLDLGGFKDRVEKMKEISKEVQDAILQNADKAFSELEAMKKK